MAHRLLSVCCIDVHRCSCTWSSCSNSYTLRSFMLVKCHWLFVTSNCTSNRPLIFDVFSYTGEYASPFGVRNTSLSLRLAVLRVPSATCWCQLALYLKSVTLTRSSVEIFMDTSPELGLFVDDLSYFMIWKDTLFIHNYFWVYLFAHLSILSICIIKITVLTKITTIKQSQTKRYVIKPYRLKLANLFCLQW